MLPILIVPAARRVKHPDYVEARRIDERDARRGAVELDDHAGADSAELLLDTFLPWAFLAERDSAFQWLH
jgi:hypothetical protein